jgi:hypothetical protein
MKGVEECARQLGAVNMKDINTQKITIFDVVTLAPLWLLTFTKLLNVMEVQEEKARAKREELARLQSQQVIQASSMPMSSGSSLKRPPPSPTSTNPPRMKRQKSGRDSDPPSPSPSQTPNQPIVADDADDADDASQTGSPDSNDSTVERDERHTKDLLTIFLTTTMAPLSSYLCEIDWTQSGHPVKLDLASTNHDLPC